jgi:hypothetical protein
MKYMDYVSNDTVIKENKLKRKMNYAPMVYFKLLSGHFYGKADEGYGP